MNDMSGIEIRMVSSEDRALLDHVANDLFDRPIDPSLAAVFLKDQRHHLAVAIADGTIVAFVSGVHYVHPDKPAQMFINEVTTASGHRGKGIGKAVLARLLDRARELDCTEAWVLTDQNNLAARGLYLSQGGKAVDAGIMYSFHFGGREES